MTSIDQFLDKLSSPQLEEIRTKALFLLRKSRTQETSDAEELYEEAREMLAGRGVAAPPYPVFLKRGHHVRSYQGMAKDLRHFVDRYLQPRCKLDRLQAYRVLLGAVERCLQQQNIPLSLRAVLTVLPKAPALIELDYPGYLASGLLAQVLLHHKPSCLRNTLGKQLTRSRSSASGSLHQLSRG